MEKPPAAPKPGTAGGSKNSSFTLEISLPFLLELLDDLLRGQLAFGPGLQIDETGPRVRAAALGQNLVTGQRGDRGDAFDLFGDRLQFVGLGVGVLKRRARRRLDDPIDHALVLERNKAGRKLDVHQVNADGKAP